MTDYFAKGSAELAVADFTARQPSVVLSGTAIILVLDSASQHFGSYSGRGALQGVGRGQFEAEILNKRTLSSTIQELSRSQVTSLAALRDEKKLKKIEQQYALAKQRRDFRHMAMLEKQMKRYQI